jgi:cytochrome c oxidase subunit 4
MSDHAAAAEGAGHPQPKYMLIWLYLFILTVSELGIAFLPIAKWMIVTTLLVMAVWKALLVALYYMHLKWEPARLRLVALAPLPFVAIMIVVIMMEYV